MDHVRDNSNNIASQLHQVRMSHSKENKLHLMIANLENKNKLLKEDLAILDLKTHDKDEEISHLKAQNFELNQRILKIAEATEHPLLQKIEKMLDAKMDNLSSAIQDKLLGRRSSQIRNQAQLVLLPNKGEKRQVLVFRKIYQ